MAHTREHTRVVWFLAALTSFLAALYYFRSGQVLLYGDAVAHINIARRVVDNIQPGPFQLGTVWLPLPHILMLPFVWSDQLWITGIAGAIPSMVAFIIAAVGIFRLIELLSARTAAWLGTLFFLFNPNLLYMQTTAMTESIYLAAMIWAVFFLCDFDRRLRDNLPASGRRLPFAAMALSAAILTRYDGWFFAGICFLAVCARLMTLEGKQVRPLLAPFLRGTLLCAAVAGLWLAWNASVFGDPLDFARGQYSARAIAARTTPKGAPPYPGEAHPVTAAIYFLKSAKLNVAEGALEKPVFYTALFGCVFTLFEKRRRFALFLVVPLLFYSLSIAYGAVPIFMPQWWPFSYYNVRYGLQLLPAFAVFFALASHYLRRVHLARWYVHAVTFVFALLGIAVYAHDYRLVPISLREARVNSVSRVEMEKQIAQTLALNVGSGNVLMFTGEYSGALQRAGIHFRDVINEGDFGVWSAALTHPSHAADWIVATEGDAVDQALREHDPGLSPVVVLHTLGKQPVRIYRGTRAQK